MGKRLGEAGGGSGIYGDVGVNGVDSDGGIVPTMVTMKVAQQQQHQQQQ